MAHIQKLHIGKVQDQVCNYKGTNLEAEKAAGKQMKGETERDENPTFVTQVLDSVK